MARIPLGGRRLRQWLPGLLLAVCAAGFASAGGLYTNADSTVDSISAQQLKRIFSLRQLSWENQERIQIFLPENPTSEYTDFVKQSIGLFPYQLRRHWDRATFSGKSTAPLLFSSDRELVQAIAATPGAIGFVPDNVDVSELKRVEITP